MLNHDRARDLRNAAIQDQSQAAALRSPGPLTTITEQLGNADSLASRVLTLVDRLLGAVPTAGNAADQNVKGDGALHEIAALARRAGRSVDAAHAALSRLEEIL